MGNNFRCCLDDALDQGLPLVDFLSDTTKIFPSRSEARKMIANGGISLNKEKVSQADMEVNVSHLLKDKYIVVQKGKKNYFLCSIS